ncbi:MAG: hypothetical protein ACE5JX_22820, partial [Acidobacteriota bacterium]
MTSLLRLFKLLGVAEQHEVLSGLRNRQSVGKGHLSSFVDEEHVDGLEELRPRPKPRGSTCD